MHSILRRPLWLLTFAFPLQAQTLPPDLSFTTVATSRNGALAVRHAGDGSGRIFVVRQGGRIDLIRADGSVDPTAFLHIGSGGTSPPLGFTTGGEQGLLGLAFHPQYAVNGRFFISYNDSGGDTAIAEYQVSAANPDRADADSGNVLLRVYQPASNHNGGDIHFGADGYLYIGMGDGGGSNDSACGTGQALVPGATSCSVAGGNSFLQPTGPNAPRGNSDSRALLGKMLRIDIDVEEPRAAPPVGADLCGADSDTGVARYDIPADNPFAGDSGSNAAACDEIYHYGLRNPWRFSFDRVTADLIIGDVGQGRWEEVDLVAPGGGLNFGWNPCEGFHVRGSTTTLCTLAGRTDPILAYGRGTGFSISGGFRYRGPYPALDGVLFFADFGGALFAELEGMSGWTTPPSPWMTGQGDIAGFGEDEGGNVYLATLGGTVRRATLSSAPPSGLVINAHAQLITDAGTQGLADSGDVIRFSATVLNSGGEALDSLVVTLAVNGGGAIPMPCGTTSLATNQGTTCAALDLTVSQADFELGAPIQAEAVASALDLDDDPVGDSDTVAMGISPPNPELTVQKSAQIMPDAGTVGVADAGDGIVYSVIVTNTGNVTLDELAVFDQLDGGPVTALTCAPLVLAPQAQATCDAYGFTVTQDHVELQQALLNVASAEARDPLDALIQASDDATVAVVTAAPQLAVEKTAMLTLDAGQTGVGDLDDVVTYAVTVSNTGNVRLTGLTVTDSLAGGAPQALSCTPTLLEPAQDASCAAYQHTVTQAEVDAGVALVNLATASATRVGDTAPVQGSDDASIALALAQPALAIDKQAALQDLDADLEADVGETISYTFSVENTGNVSLSGVAVQDPMLGAAISCSPSLLAPAAVASCGPAHYVVNVDDLATAAVMNTAIARGTPPAGGTIDSAPDGTSTPTDQGDIIFGDGFEE